MNLGDVRHAASKTGGAVGRVVLALIDVASHAQALAPSLDADHEPARSLVAALQRLDQETHHDS